MKTEIIQFEEAKRQMETTGKQPKDDLILQEWINNAVSPANGLANAEVEVLQRRSEKIRGIQNRTDD